jgi:hypothetical protein
MSAFKAAGFAERRNTSLEARKAAMQDFRSKAAADVSTFEQRQETLKAVRTARDSRAAERLAARTTRAAEIADQFTREQAAAAEAEQAAKARREQDRADAAQLETTRQAEAKAARDARYAARKARR